MNIGIKEGNVYWLIMQTSKKLIYAYAYAHNMTKVISLSDSAYAEMKAIKRKDESFSDIVHRLTGKARRKSLIDFFGCWPGDKGELDKISKIIEKDRKNFKTREVRL